MNDPEEKSSEILSLIKKRTSVRKYQKRSIPKTELDKVIEAGLLGPALLKPGFQPWRFVAVRERNTIQNISEVMKKRAREISIEGRIILAPSAKVVENANVIIAVYVVPSLTASVKRLNEEHMKFAEIAEVCSVSAAIQNMVLTAASLGIGSCWLDTPLFCEDEINRLLEEDEKLIAILTFGYPAEEGKRAQRKPVSEALRFVE